MGATRTLTGLGIGGALLTAGLSAAFNVNDNDPNNRTWLEWFGSIFSGDMLTNFANRLGLDPELAANLGDSNVLPLAAAMLGIALLPGKFGEKGPLNQLKSTGFVAAGLAAAFFSAQSWLKGDYDDVQIAGLDTDLVNRFKKNTVTSDSPPKVNISDIVAKAQLEKVAAMPSLPFPDTEVSDAAARVIEDAQEAARIHYASARATRNVVAEAQAAIERMDNQPTVAQDAKGGFDHTPDHDPSIDLEMHNDDKMA